MSEPNFNPVDGNETDDMEKRLRRFFEGKVVRKDLTKRIKEGANVPTYVLEYLLGMYCATEDEVAIEKGVETVKNILASNFVRPDEADKIISKLREQGSYTVIDKVTVKLNTKTDIYEAVFSNLGIQNVPVPPEYPKEFERLLGGGIWCIIQMEYFFNEEDKKSVPFIIKKLTPIQMPGLDFNQYKEGRAFFSQEEWIDIIIRSMGLEPTQLSKRQKWLHLARLIPLAENNVNLCELGPRGTGKSHIYKDISPNSILISGGQTTVANLFYNMSNRTIGLVGLWDCVAFDEVAGIKFKDQDGVQIMKDYMASGSFARGKEEKNASASMVFVGNINQSVDTLLKTSNLFEPFPAAMGADTAFLDRMHCYIPGWEIPKYRPEHFTDQLAFITDYFAEVLRELRKTSYADAYTPYFKLGKDLNQRDVIAVKKILSGLVKILYPDGQFTKDQIEEILRFALEQRRRVKEQLKKIGGMEFFDVNFSYIDNQTFEEEFVTVPEQGSGKLIPEGIGKPGHLYTVSRGKTGMFGVYKIETQMTPGNGKFEKSGVGTDHDAKESIETAFRYLRANAKGISASISTTTKDYQIHVQDMGGNGAPKMISLPSLIAVCSIALGKPPLSSLAIIGDFTIGGTLIKAEELANVLQVCLDGGAKRVLLPMSSVPDFASVPADLLGRFNLIFYESPEAAVFKALGVE